MTKYPAYLEYKQVPDADLLTKIKVMIKDGKGPKQMKIELPDASLCSIRMYYSKVRRGVW